MHTVLGEHVWYGYNRITAELPAKTVKTTIKKLLLLKSSFKKVRMLKGCQKPFH